MPKKGGKRAKGGGDGASWDGQDTYQSKGKKGTGGGDDANGDGQDTYHSVICWGGGGDDASPIACVLDGLLAGTELVEPDKEGAAGSSQFPLGLRSKADWDRHDAAQTTVLHRETGGRWRGGVVVGVREETARIFLYAYTSI